MRGEQLLSCHSRRWDIGECPVSPSHLTMGRGASGLGKPGSGGKDRQIQERGKQAARGLEAGLSRGQRGRRQPPVLTCAASAPAGSSLPLLAQHKHLFLDTLQLPVKNVTGQRENMPPTHADFRGANCSH